MVVVKGVEKHLQKNVRTAFLRKITPAMWDELMEALPRCKCGKVVAPSRAVRGYKTHAWACIRKERRIDKRQLQAEREAIAASIGQQ